MKIVKALFSAGGFKRAQHVQHAVALACAQVPNICAVERLDFLQCSSVKSPKLCRDSCELLHRFSKTTTFMPACTKAKLVRANVTGCAHHQNIFFFYVLFFLLKRLLTIGQSFVPCSIASAVPNHFDLIQMGQGLTVSLNHDLLVKVCMYPLAAGIAHLL